MGPTSNVNCVNLELYSGINQIDGSFATLTLMILPDTLAPITSTSKWANASLAVLMNPTAAAITRIRTDKIRSEPG